MPSHVVRLVTVCALLVLSGCEAQVTGPTGGGSAGGASSSGGGDGAGGGVASAGGQASMAGGSATAGGAAMGGGAASAGGAASGGGSAVADAGTGTVGMFVAVGHVNRSTISCDDGRTWVANQSDNDDIRCFTSTPDGGSADCDHKYGAGRGIAWSAQSGFVGNWGWGDPGVIRKSRDGVTWTVVDRGSNFASMVVGSDGTLFAASRSGKVSRNAGDTWTAAGTANLMAMGMPVWNVRRGGAGGTGAGVFVVVADSNTAMVSSDAMTWRAPQTYPATCGANIQWEGGVASGNGVLVILGGDGVACRSTDDGVTWTAHQTGGTIDARLLWTGTEFITWGTVANQRRVMRSPDGMTWTTAATSLRRNGAPVAGNGPLIGAVARSPTGTFVAVNGGWQTWYASQRFFRSADGVTWDELPAGAFVGSHPISHIAWGEGARSALCP